MYVGVKPINIILMLTFSSPSLLVNDIYVRRDVQCFYPDHKKLLTITHNADSSIEIWKLDQICPNFNKLLQETKGGKRMKDDLALGNATHIEQQ